VCRASRRAQTYRGSTADPLHVADAAARTPMSDDDRPEHAEVVGRFGRFPHRNATLGRLSTPAEIEYLNAGGATYGQALVPERADVGAEGADMATSTVRVIATFAVRPEHVDEFIRVARETLVVPTRAEPGCLRYDLWQDAADRTRFAMVEEWESAAALDTHLARESLRAAVARLTPMAAESPKVSRFRSVADAT
jgi:quinol monooxygenase YgiN